MNILQNLREFLSQNTPMPARFFYLRDSAKPLLILCILASSLCAQESLAQRSHFSGQYATRDGQTTMTIYGNRHGLKISGRGQFSSYHGRCNITSPYTAVCSGEGTRFKDRQRYRGSYELRASRNSDRLTSRWTVTFDSGEQYRGVSHMSKIN